MSVGFLSSDECIVEYFLKCGLCQDAQPLAHRPNSGGRAIVSGPKIILL